MKINGWQVFMSKYRITVLPGDGIGRAAMEAARFVAITGVIVKGRVRTYDMGGTHRTLDMARAVLGKIQNLG